MESFEGSFTADHERDIKKLWNQLRFDRMGPERRGYHSSVIHNGTLYIHGGHDIKVGTIDNIWALDLTKLNSLKKTVDIH